MCRMSLLRGDSDIVDVFVFRHWNQQWWTYIFGFVSVWTGILEDDANVIWFGDCKWISESDLVRHLAPLHSYMPLPRVHAHSSSFLRRLLSFKASDYLNSLDLPQLAAILYRDNLRRVYTPSSDEVSNQYGAHCTHSTLLGYPCSDSGWNTLPTMIYEKRWKGIWPSRRPKLLRCVHP